MMIINELQKAFRKDKLTRNLGVAFANGLLLEIYLIFVHHNVFHNFVVLYGIITFAFSFMRFMKSMDWRVFIIEYD